MSSPSLKPVVVAPFRRTSDTWLLTQRETLTAFTTTSVPAGGLAAIQANFGFGRAGTDFGASPAIFTVNPGEALRITNGTWCACVGPPAGVKTLSCQSLSLDLHNQSTTVRRYAANYTGNILGTTGQILTVETAEMLYGSDFVEQSLNLLGFFFRCVADVNSTDAAAQNVTLSGMIQFERWRMTTMTRLRG